MVRGIRFAAALAVLGSTLWAAEGEPKKVAPIKGAVLGGGGNIGMEMFLLRNKAVQEDLKLSEDQLKKLEEQFAKADELRKSLAVKNPDAAKQFQEAQEALAKIGEAVKGTLTDDQKKRVGQIALQRGGPTAVMRPDIAGQMNFTDEQKEKLKAIAQEQGQKTRELFQNGKDGDRAELVKKFEELRKEHGEKIVGVLTDEQKSKWKELVGEPFKGELTPFGVGGAVRPLKVEPKKE